MKRFIRLCAVLMALVMIFGVSTIAYAAGSVTYDGDADKFIFAPGTKDSPTNLFENFQNVMPGDTLTESILIKNDTSHDIKVYVRSLGAQEDTAKFLSQMILTVKQKDDSILFKAPSNETAQLTEWVCLGTVSSDAEITLDIMLEVPITMSNDYQNSMGYIDWEFKVEELPDESEFSEEIQIPEREEVGVKTPATGDSSSVLLYSILIVVSLIALFVLVPFSIKRTKGISK